ncbi:MAG TPA: pitrilysin family protein [Spirochaetia bacterium]|nr:pitrilysin family protein [Spirochaetia bacterium]
MIYTERLASGATLLLEPVDRTDTLCIGFWFLHGSRDEAPSRRGYSHLLEHMLFKGTARRSAFTIAREVDRVGGLINAFTEKETTCLYTIIPREHLRLAFDILTDMTVASTLDPAELEKEKEVIINEIRSADDSPEEKGHDRYLKEMWGEHPLAHKITGEVEDVRGAGREALAQFSSEWLVPANTIIAVAGNFHADEARALASAVFPSAGPHQRPARAVPEWKRRVCFVPDRFNQVQVYAGTCYPLTHAIAPYYTSLVFSTAFGESMSSRLFQKLREEQGLCYTVYSFRTFFSDLGMWTIYANTTPAQTARFLEALDGELSRLLKEPLSDREIEDAKSHLVGSMILSREDMETRMKRLVRQFLMMDRILSFEESVAALRAVTPASAEEYARACLRPDSFSLLAYGSRGVGKHRAFDFSFAGGAHPRGKR